MNAPIRRIKVWFDQEGDYLEVRFSDDPGYMRETESDDVMERVDSEGNVIGFSILHVSRFPKNKPIVAELLENR